MNALLKSWKTTVFGGVPGLAMMVEGVQSKNYGIALGGLGILLVSIFAKDHNVTGGTQG